MKITFYSNFLNHHQLPFCLELVKAIGSDFTFVATEPIPQSRLKLGYKDMNEDHLFVLRAYESADSLENAKNLSNTSDVVIIGSAPSSFISNRKINNKITFIYTERLFKKRVLAKIMPFIVYKYYIKFIKNQSPNLLVLCAGGHVKKDLRYIGFKGRTLKWGYFPDFREKKFDDIILSHQSKTIKLLWVGRLIGWKRVFDALYVAKRLMKKGFDFELTIIGEGIQNKKVKTYITRNNLTCYVRYIGSVPSDSVKEYMERSQIFLFTSNHEEGWGVVLNEAMNSGCVVVASNAPGATPFLIKNNYNGLIYKSGNRKELFIKTVELLKDEKLRIELAKNAYNTLETEWNAKIAAKRFLTSVEALLNNDKTFSYDSGPISDA